MPKKLLSPEDVRHFLVRRFENQHENWLAGEGTWPLVVSLGVPTEKDVAEDPVSVRSWVSAWQTRTGPGELVLEERRFPRLGTQRLPASLSFDGAATVASAIGQALRWSIATQRWHKMARRWPALAAGRALASRFDMLADYHHDDFEGLMSLLAWLEANRASNLYMRQLPVEGVDTKWMEKRRRLVGGLLRAIRGLDDEAIDFDALCGFRKPAHRLRVRLLCPALRLRVARLGDIEAPVDELANLPIQPQSAIIVENLETGLALPDVRGAVAIVGLGNAVSALGRLHWLSGVQAVYWGDIDTHGFAILARARKALPQIRSVLMDEATLLAHRLLWGKEPQQCMNVPMETLTDSERAVCDGLRAHAWGQRVRLEQERLSWDHCLRRLIDELK
ncbi:MAG TPA: Wadjet anti-phage system protein JetD domain-containing protein [Burkholderiaceae bacterium]|nr:Wadjet anti-phage system protein JetD domain-containing protein [Burkholderiaceae bacterium]